MCTQLIGSELGDAARPIDMGATFICGTDTAPPTNPMFEYAKGVLGLKLKPKMRDGPIANVVYDRCGCPVRKGKHSERMS